MILYAIRSTKGVVRLSASEKASINIPEDTKEVLVGILLGDAHIVQRSATSNCKLVYTQTAVDHKNYFRYLRLFFLPFCPKDYIPQSRTVKDKKTGNTYKFLSFTTMQLPCFNEFRKLFYTLNVKIVPHNIYELLTPRALAHWIMDNGSRHSKGLHLSVYEFSSADVDRLMNTLQNKFNFTCSIHYNRDNKPCIYIFKESLDSLRDMVEPYFLDDMLYKLDL